METTAIDGSYGSIEAGNITSGFPFFIQLWRRCHLNTARVWNFQYKSCIPFRLNFTQIQGCIFFHIEFEQFLAFTSAHSTYNLLYFLRRIEPRNVVRVARPQNSAHHGTFNIVKGTKQHHNRGCKGRKYTHEKDKFYPSFSKKRTHIMLLISSYLNDTDLSFRHVP